MQIEKIHLFFLIKETTASRIPIIFLFSLEASFQFLANWEWEVKAI